MGRQPNWFRDLVATVSAETAAREALNKPPPPKRKRISTAHARKYQQLANYPYPAEFYAFTCGARTRAGTPCKLRPFHANGRCKFHGGPSTGPKTAEGRRQSAENGKKGGRPRKCVGDQESKNLTP